MNTIISNRFIRIVIIVLVVFDTHIASILYSRLQSLQKISISSLFISPSHKGYRKFLQNASSIFAKNSIQLNKEPVSLFHGLLHLLKMPPAALDFVCGFTLQNNLSSYVRCCFGVIQATSKRSNKYLGGNESRRLSM